MSGPDTSRSRLRVLWVFIALVTAVCLVLGSQKPSSHEGLVQRTARLESMVKCPVCDGESVADSSAAVAVTIRGVIASDVQSGQSDAQIETELQGRYGEGILLSPSKSGTEGLVWLVPVLAFVIASIGLGAFFWLRSRRTRESDLADTEDVSASDQERVAAALRGLAPGSAPGGPPGDVPGGRT